PLWLGLPILSIPACESQRPTHTTWNPPGLAGLIHALTNLDTPNHITKNAFIQERPNLHMTTILIVRHGESEPQTEGINDQDRKLVKKGVKQMRRVANFLEEMGYEPDQVMVSPMLRAVQSAEVILDEMGLDMKAETLEDLLPDKDPSSLAEKLKELQGTILIVGHEPHLSKLVKALTSAEVEIKRGGLAVVEVDVTEKTSKLELLLTQKVMKLI
ncbi:MAG: phosphohistidine phosphatase SixA, partial [Metallosphaera sp.]